MEQWEKHGRGDDGVQHGKRNHKHNGRARTGGKKVVEAMGEQKTVERKDKLRIA